MSQEALQPCASCGCFVHAGTIDCPHCRTSASSLGRRVVHATVIAMLGAATACESTPVYGFPTTDGTLTTVTGDTSDTGDDVATDQVPDTGTAGDTGAP